MKEHSSMEADGSGWRLTATHAAPQTPNAPVAILFLDVLHIARDGTLQVRQSLRAYQ